VPIRIVIAVFAGVALIVVLVARRASIFFVEQQSGNADPGPAATRGLCHCDRERVLPAPTGHDFSLPRDGGGESTSGLHLRHPQDQEDRRYSWNGRSRPSPRRRQAPLERGVIEHKYYVKGVGNVTIMIKGGAEEERLVSITREPGYVWRLQIRSSPTCSKPSRR
jgi:hypothetical protein